MMTVALRRFVAIAAPAMLFTAVSFAAQSPGYVSLLEQTDVVPQISKERAITRAVNATGLKMTPSAVEYGLATDTSIPFFNVVKRPAWRVNFEGVEIFGRKREGTLEKNPNIRSISVLMDAQTGALLKVSCPRPLPGSALGEYGGPLESRVIQEDGLVIRATEWMPTIPFMQVLAVADRHERIAFEANKLVAYFGLMTDTLRIHENIKDRPYWIIFARGLDLSFTSGGPPGAPPPPPATNAMIVIDAESGNRYLTGLTGEGN